MEVSGRKGAGKEKRENRRNGRKCEPCSGVGVSTKPDGVCIECEEFMCHSCFKHHLKAKQCRNHVFDSSFSNTVPLKKDFEVDKCKRHAGELIKFYCRKHETVGCGECMIPDHAGCFTEKIKNLCKEYRCSREFAGLERSVKDVECLAEVNKTKIKENKNANAEMYEKALNGIKQFRKDINTFLDNAETTIIQEVKEVSDANDKRLTNLEKDCMLQSSRIAEVSRQMDPDLYSESGLFIQSVTLKYIFRDLQQTVCRILQENNIKKFNFVPDTRLQSLTKSIQHFGKIRCSSPSSTVFKDEAPKLEQKTPNTRAKENAILDAADAVNKKKERCVNTKIVVGSRVRARHSVLPLGNGTVTHVGKNDTVTVEWNGVTMPTNYSIKEIELL